MCMIARAISRVKTPTVICTFFLLHFDRHPIRLLRIPFILFFRVRIFRNRNDERARRPRLGTIYLKRFSYARNRKRPGKYKKKKKNYKTDLIYSIVFKRGTKKKKKKNPPIKLPTK